MKKVLSLLLLSAFIITGCNSESSKSESSKSEEIKVVSLAPNITENIIGLGMEDVLVGVDTFSIFNETSNLPMFDALNVNSEEIIGLAPTHILVYEYSTGSSKDSMYDIFRNNGIEVVGIKNASTIDDIYSNITEIGEVLNVEKQSEELINEMKSDITEIENKYKENPSKTVYIEISPDPSLVTTGGNSFLDEMITIANGENIFASETGWFSPSVEQIIEKNPEIILTNVSYIDSPVEEIIKREGFNKIDAVSNNKVYLVDTNPTSRASYKIIDGIKEIAFIINDEN